MSLSIFYIYIYLFKDFKHKKTLTSKQPTKQKISVQKTTKAVVFCAYNLPRGWKSLDFCFALFVCEESFCKKNNKQAWNCPDTLNSLYYWRVPLSTHLWRIYFYTLIFICNHLWESLLFMRIFLKYFLLWESLFIYDHLFESLLFMRILLNFSYLWKFLFSPESFWIFTCENLFFFMTICLNLTFNSIIKISKSMNPII